MSPGLAVALGLLMLAGALVLLLVGLAWFLFQRVLPRRKKPASLPGLGAAVEVLWDRWGVPHLYAHSQADAMAALGFLHAQDRLFQMEYSRRLAAGTMAQRLGQAALDADRWSRIIGFRRAAEQDLAALPAVDRALLERYAAGVNAFVQANYTRLPAEFALLGYKPDPWTAQDSLGILKVMGWAMSQNWEAELLRVQLLDLLGPDRAKELEPLYPPGGPIILPGQDTFDSAAAGRLLDAYRDLATWFGPSSLAGSNNWVVDANHSATRRPLLANDPHLTVGLPSLWYQAHLEAVDDGLQVTGATLPGVPGVLIGHNARIAWGITAGRGDLQDLYIERPHPEQPTWFECDGQWQPAQVLRESILVRGQAEPHVEEVLVTRHGPLINGLIDSAGRSDLPPLSLCWSGHRPSMAFHGLLELQRAGDWGSFRAALTHVGEPSLNLVYADVDGNIGYQYVGRIPKRRAGHGLVPSPGWHTAHDWEGWLPFEALPSVLNPAEGYLLSANNKPVADDYRYYLGAEWYPGYRAARIQRMLQVKPRFTVRDFQRMQMDVYSVQAEALVPFLIMTGSEDPFERRIIAELEAWNLRVDVDSFAAAAYEVARLHLLDLVFADKLGSLAAHYQGRSRSDIFAASGFPGTAGVCLVNLLEQEESWWFHDAASGQSRSREQLVQEALKRTAQSLYQMIGKDPRKWAWGKVHQVEFPHLLGRGWLLRSIFNRGQYPVSGDEHTVWMTANDLKLPFGLVTTTATYRQVLDVGNWDRCTAVLSTGQSGQPGSPHYADQIDMWREGEQNPMLWSRQAVEDATTSRQRLIPALDSG